MNSILHSELISLADKIEIANQFQSGVQPNPDKTTISYADFDPNDIPTPVYNYYSGKTHLSFLKLLRRLKGKLGDFKGETEAQCFYKYLFLYLIAYYNDDISTFVKINRKLKGYSKYETHKVLINYLMYDVFEQTDILILVSDTYQKNNNYFSLKKYFTKIEIKMFANYADKAEIFKLFGLYQQVFLIGHGGDNYIKIGNERIEEVDFINYAAKGNTFPTVLGVLSCNHLLTDSELVRGIDNFITDNEFSVPDYSEMFLHGYFRSYKKTKDIKASFYAGKITPLFRNRAPTSFQLYQNGIKQ